MSKIQHYRLGAIVRVGTKYLLVRSRGADGVPLSGFHVPSRPLNELKPERMLRRFFADYYGSDIIIKGSLCPIVKAGDSLSVYFVEEVSPLAFPCERFEYGFYSLADLENLDIEEADKVAIEKADCYLPMLEQRIRVTPLLPIQIDKINKMLESIRYFHSKIPSEERKQFLNLVNSEISYEGILRAYRFLLKQYEANYFQFIDRNGKPTPFDV